MSRVKQVDSDSEGEPLETGWFQKVNTRQKRKPVQAVNVQTQQEFVNPEPESYSGGPTEADIIDYLYSLPNVPGTKVSTISKQENQ